MSVPLTSRQGTARQDTPDGRIAVLIADPHWSVREGLKTVLNAQPDVCVIGEAGDSPTALTLAADLNPDLVILETALPDLDGARVTVRLRDGCDRKVLALTACEDAGSVRLLLGVGAKGYVLKRSPVEHLVQAVRVVAAGGTFLDSVMTGRVVGGFLSAGEWKSAAELSEREALVMRLIALGYGNKEIAGRLRLSIKTVETYKTRSMKKLQLHGRVDIVRFATRRGWLADDVPEPTSATPDLSTQE